MLHGTVHTSLVARSCNKHTQTHTHTAPKGKKNGSVLWQIDFHFDKKTSVHSLEFCVRSGTGRYFRSTTPLSLPWGLPLARLEKKIGNVFGISVLMCTVSRAIENELFWLYFCLFFYRRRGPMAWCRVGATTGGGVGGEWAGPIQSGERVSAGENTCVPWRILVRWQRCHYSFTQSQRVLVDRKAANKTRSDCKNITRSKKIAKDGM